MATDIFGRSEAQQFAALEPHLGIYRSYLQNNPGASEADFARRFQLHPSEVANVERLLGIDFHPYASSGSPPSWLAGPSPDTDGTADGSSGSLRGNFGASLGDAAAAASSPMGLVVVGGGLLLLLLLLRKR